MDEETLHARHLAELGFLKDALAGIGYSVRLLERSASMPYHTLIVELPGLADGEARWQLSINVYPIGDEEFADTLFLQYFVALSATPGPTTRLATLELIAEINNRLVLGHVGLGANDSRAHFRYVQAVPADDLLDAEKVRAVLLLVTYSPRLFDGALRGVAEGSMALDAARAQLAEAYGPA